MVAVINPLLREPTLDPEYLASYRPISNLHFEAVAEELWLSSG